MQRRHFLYSLAASPLMLSAAARAGGRLDAATTVRSLARETRALYHDDKMGAAIADRLLAALRAGKFANAGSRDQLANLLSAEIATASKDMHFVVMFGSMGNPPVPPSPPHTAPPPLSAAELRYLHGINFGIAAAEVLPGNVARIDIRQFYRPAWEVREKIAHAMALLADSSAMVVDLSRNPGGDPAAVAHFTSYFFDSPPFVLNRLRWRNRAIEEFYTEATLPGPRYERHRPVVVQMSGSSFSAAEEFAYNMQAMKRGIVVGQPSGGGANHALPVLIAGGFTAFIPQARAENPVTKSNWEAVGVKPDVVADEASMARAAHRAALERVAASADEDRAALARRALAEA